jgi:SH3-like domain-containing protein
MKKTIWILLFLIIGYPVSPAEALCVKAATANIRSGPGIQYEAVWKVSKYMPFEKVGISVSKDWYAVRDVDDDVNWIHKDLVTDAFLCAVVKVSEVNVRKGPGTQYGKAYANPAGQYSSFRVVKNDQSWVEVKDESGKAGWIHSKFLWIQ